MRWGPALFSSLTQLGPTCGAIAIARDGDDLARGVVDEVIPVASITKALFGYAVMIAVEEHALSLDQPCGAMGSTVRHLLAHASGFGFTATDPVSAPGLRRVYSNHGFDVLGELLERETQLSPANYLRDAVLEPLQMRSTSLKGSPAKDAFSTARDLSLFVIEMLAPTLVHPSTFTNFTAVQFPDLAGIVPGVGHFRPNPWGLGVEIRGAKHPHWTGRTNSIDTFGHFGGQGSMFWVDPLAGVGLVVTNSRPFGPWALEAWPTLSDAVLVEH